MGLTPVAVGRCELTAVQPEPLVPGSAVSAKLVRGDLSIAGHGDLCRSEDAEWRAAIRLRSMGRCRCR
jgi:hypothetical protein